MTVAEESLLNVALAVTENDVQLTRGEFLELYNAAERVRADRITPEQALEAIQNLRTQYIAGSLDESDYINAIGDVMKKVVKAGYVQI